MRNYLFVLCFIVPTFGLCQEPPQIIAFFVLNQDKTSKEINATYSYIQKDRFTNRIDTIYQNTLIDTFGWANRPKEKGYLYVATLGYEEIIQCKIEITDSTDKMNLLFFPKYPPLGFTIYYWFDLFDIELLPNKTLLWNGKMKRVGNYLKIPEFDTLTSTDLIHILTNEGDTNYFYYFPDGKKAYGYSKKGNTTMEEKWNNETGFRIHYEKKSHNSTNDKGKSVLITYYDNGKKRWKVKTKWKVIGNPRTWNAWTGKPKRVVTVRINWDEKGKKTRTKKVTKEEKN